MLSIKMYVLVQTKVNFVGEKRVVKVEVANVSVAIVEASSDELKAVMLTLGSEMNRFKQLVITTLTAEIKANVF